MINILFLIHDLGPGGAEKVLVNLVNNLNKDIFDITVLALFGGGVNEQFLSQGVRYQYIYKRVFPLNSHIMKFFSPKFLHDNYIKENYDIEVSYLEGPSARIISGCSNPQTKLVSWIHSCVENRRIAAGSFRNFNESQRCYSAFDATVAVSDLVKRKFLNVYPELRNIQVLFNTIETEKICQMKDEAVPNGVFSEKEFKICGVGKIAPSKGFMKLARIHKRLRENNYPVHTYLLGEGIEKPAIKSYIMQQGLQDTFTFLGYQTNPYKYVEKCDVFVCTSESEGFSTAATEAVIVNTPIITTPVSGMKELLGDDPCGIISGFDEEDIYQELLKWVSNPEIVTGYKEKTRIRAKQFSQKETVKQTEVFFRELLASSARGE